MESPTSTKFKAFISYAHADEAWARWLHRSLENYRPPKTLASAKSLKPIFRDRDDLASAGTLSDSLTQALSDSASLIVICSPAAVSSKWVGLEIERFKELHSNRPVLCVVVEGDPPSCFPHILRDEEPLAADARRSGDGRKDALLKIAAALLEVDLDDLKQRDLHRRNRRLLTFSSLTFVGLLAASALAVYAWLARNEAIRQAQIANATTDFVVDVFKVADPSEARGQQVTAKEVLDRGVERVNDSMGPEVQGRLLQTLGRVYNGLGLYNRAETLLTLSNQHDDQLETKIALADTQFMQGDYTTAIAAFEQLAAAQTSNWTELSAKIHNGLGDALNYAGQAEAAVNSLEVTLEKNRNVFGEFHETTAHSLASLASAHYFAGDTVKARALYEKAYRSAVESVGEFHPNTVVLLNDMANIDYVGNDVAAALAGYRQALPYYERVFGDEHPEVATIRNNIGRILFETNQTKEAAQWLTDAAATFTKLSLAQHPTVVYLYNTLGLAHKANGNLAAAAAALAQAAAISRNTQHRLEGPILVELADVHCRQDKRSTGRDLLLEAEPKLIQYREQAHRMAIARSVALACSAAPPDLDQLAKTRDLITAHYGSQHPFTRDAQTRLEPR